MLLLFLMTESSPPPHLKPRIKRIVKSEIDTTQELLDRGSYELWKRVTGRVWDPRETKFRNKPTSDLKWTEKGTKSNLPLSTPSSLLSCAPQLLFVHCCYQTLWKWNTDKESGIPNVDVKEISNLSHVLAFNTKFSPTHTHTPYTNFH